MIFKSPKQFPNRLKMIPWTFLTFAKKSRVWVQDPTFGPQIFRFLFDVWLSGGPSGPREYFMDDRGENPVQSEREMLDLVPYGPPWREKGWQFWGVFFMKKRRRPHTCLQPRKCCVCSQDICIVSSQDICIVSSEDICIEDICILSHLNDKNYDVRAAAPRACCGC